MSRSGVGLDENAGLALVGVAQLLAGFNGLGHQCIQVGGERNARAVGALAAEVGQAVALHGFKAVDRLGQHQRQRVLPAPRGPARISDCGKRSAPMLSRSRLTVAELPRKSEKPTLRA